MRLLLLSLLVAVAGCTSSRPAAVGAGSTLTGTVTYLQRIALPPDAVVTVRLLDVSLADAPSATLAEQKIPTEGRNVPIAYALSYDPDRIEPRRRYAVRAEVRDGAGALRWTTDTTIPVLTQGAPSDDVEIRVVQVGEAGAAPGTDGLVGPVWRLVEIATPDGAALRPEADEVLTITFAPDGRYSGQADCNRIGGAYTVDATGALDLSQGATTLAACAPPSSGDAFVQALAQVERVGVSEGRMALRGPGRALVFERADLGMAPQPTGRTLVFGCDQAFTFRIRTGPGEIALWLPERFGDRTLVLGQVRAASGARYQDGDVTVWTKGDEALLEVDGESFAGCRLQG
ncbi:YbaY family lipoprotein [Rubrivirga sp.]|uniref:YbaY family lipoprotein n=1 Tax=Rubrivirga sp. TaxID=1885344 RepID=UPI003B52D3EF